MRLVIAQTKVPDQSISATQVFTSGNQNNAYYPFGSVIGPLQAGVSRNYKILKSYIVKLDD